MSVDVWESFEIIEPIRTMHEAEIHWYEAADIGMHWAKIKRFLE